MENILKDKSMIEKYNCLTFYLNIISCVEKANEHENIICRDDIKLLGECVYNGLKNEENKDKLI